MTGPLAGEPWRLIGLAILALSAGWLLGIPGWSLSAVLAIELGRHLARQRRFLHWLRHGKPNSPPILGGGWDELVYAVQRMQQRYRRRKKRMGRLLKRFRESSAAMPDATVILGPQYEIEWFNEAAIRLLGLHARQDTGQRINHLLRHPRFVEYLYHSDYSEAVELPAPHDDRLRLNLRIVPYGKNQSLLAIRDVTRLYRLEQMRQDFVANVSHELRTPLTVISGYLETINDPDEVYPPYLRTSLTQMQQQAQRMQRLIEDLLTLSRLETDLGCVPDYVPVAMDVLLATLQAETMILSEGRHRIEVETDAEHGLTGVAAELHSAFSNLASNAVRYTQTGGRIVLRWYTDADGGHFEVDDNGPGIEPHHLPRLTERFYRVERDRSRITGGTGLGLAIVKHVLQRHDATLRIESVPGQGSLFACDFPNERLCPTDLAAMPHPAPGGSELASAP